MIPRPVSLHDQMATSVVAYRKSFWLLSVWTYGMRMIVAIDALGGRIVSINEATILHTHPSLASELADRWRRNELGILT